MTKEQLAAQINGREYGQEITEAEEKEAKSNGLVVIFGASDDLCELRGAIDDEVDADGGITIYILDDVLLPAIYHDDTEVLQKHGVLQLAKDRLKKALAIKVTWGESDYSWEIKTAAPHASFDVMENGERFCLGIVIDLKEIAS